jgi:hypothetical protein
MKSATKVALFAYLEALKAEGMTHVHVGSIIPHHNMTSLELAKAGMKWTQFPNIHETELPEGIFYDRLSGWFFFDEVMYRKVQVS